MEHAQWKFYRGHMIVERRSGLFGRKRYDVWKGGEIVASFRDGVRAELYVDGLPRA